MRRHLFSNRKDLNSKLSLPIYQEMPEDTRNSLVSYADKTLFTRNPLAIRCYFSGSVPTETSNFNPPLNSGRLPRWFKLLKSNFCTFSFKLSLDIFSFFLRSSLFKNLRSAINNVLSFF